MVNLIKITTKTAEITIHEVTYTEQQVENMMKVRYGFHHDEAMIKFKEDIRELYSTNAVFNLGVCKYTYSEIKTLGKCEFEKGKEVIEDI